MPKASASLLTSTALCGALLLAAPAAAQTEAYDAARVAPPASTPATVAAPPASPSAMAPASPRQSAPGAPAVDPAPSPEALAAPREDAPSSRAVESSASATVVFGADAAPRSTRADHAEPAADGEDDGGDRTLHGFRLGYLVQMNYDEPREPEDPSTSPKRELDLRSPHQFIIGYELAHRLRDEGEWLNVLLVASGMVAGLEQSRFMPTLNLLLGFELSRALQLGVGINLAPVDVKPAHMVLAAGWTPRSGDLYLPLHFFFVPDVDGHHRTGVTVGVNWGT